jgi:hypothetical protein
MTMEESDEEMCSDDWNKVIMKYDSETWSGNVRVKLKMGKSDDKI